jgi:WASH complex subunit strumpellin
MSDFLAEICGQTLLKLVARGNSIIAELHRLAQHVPPALTGEDDVSARRYGPILFDFRYLKTPEMFEKIINTGAEMTELDDEFYATHEEVLARFYSLFEALCKFYSDFSRFLSDLSEGFYITHTLSGVLLDPEGKQLMCEALYLWGVMLLLMDRRLPGPIRERLIIAHYRHKGESTLVPINDLATLCRSTGFDPAQPSERPPEYPCSFFGRCPLPQEFLAMVLARLRSDDLYSQLRVYPAPEHQSFALASQASVLFVALFFSPKTLHGEKKEMREIVDKYFCDNWMVSCWLLHRKQCVFALVCLIL